MNQRKLGRTDLHVSALGLDLAALGRVSDVSSVFALLDTYHESGGNFIQVAGLPASPAGRRLSEGGSEDLAGRWLAARGIDRDSVMLASTIRLPRQVRGGSRALTEFLRETCARSLHRLGTAHLDLLVGEWHERAAPVDDLLEALDQLIREGSVRAAVAGGFPSWRVMDSLHRSNLRNQARFEAVQDDYSLIDRTPVEPETFSLCGDQRLGFIARSPLAGGLLARRPVSLREVLNLDRDWHDGRFRGTLGNPLTSLLAATADRRGVTPAQVALAWVLQNPHVTAAIVAPPSADELSDLIRATDLILSADETAALANIAKPVEAYPESRHA